jgi:copper chaperone CopZ
MRKVQLKLENMHCDACVRRVTMTLEKTGAKIEEVRVGSARIEAPESLDNPTLVQALGKAGYPATVEGANA